MPIYLPPISRRRFLAGTLSAGASLLLPRRLMAEERPVDPNLVVLLSDLHITEDRTLVRHDVKSPETFEEVRARILALPSRPAGIVVSGDCASNHGDLGDYVMLAELLKPLREAGISIHLAIGNHDRRDNFLKAFPDQAAQIAKDATVADRVVSVWETAQANWFLLDSWVDKKSSGWLGEKQLAWLAQALDARPDKPALVVAHHNLVIEGFSEYARGRGVLDTDAFLDVLLPRKQVKAYMFGHLHQWNTGQVKGLTWVNIPSTAWGAPTTEPTGLVTCRLRPDGASLLLDTLDPKHPKQGDKFELKWRT